MRRALLAAAILCASCAHHAAGTVATSTPSPSASAPPTAAPTIAPTPRATQAPVAATPRPAAGIAVPGAGSSTQAIVVRTPSWNATVGTLEVFEKDSGAWKVVVPPVTAHVGYNGFAQDKREGDGRTPAGVYGLSLAFGTDADPGTHLTYRRATQNDVWVDDPSSSLYNTWQTAPANGRWRSAEQLYQPAPYAYAAAVAYNTARTPGRGSAIFLHISLGHATSGCVSIDESALLRVLRWLDPVRRPVIVMGPSSYVDSL